jgi:hypothetical protein
MQLAGMSEQPLARLQKILDLLESNVWLELDELSFPRFFGGPLRRASSEFEAAEAFAKQHNAVAIFQPNPRVVKFGRANRSDNDNG